MLFTELDLDPRLLRSIAERGYTTLTQVQEQTLARTLPGQDVAVQSQTGTGKTAAFMLPILQRLIQGRRRQARALIIAPTRGLAEQIHETVGILGRHTGLRSVTV